MRKLVFSYVWFTLIICTACARFDPALRKSHAEQFAKQSGFTMSYLSSGQFDVWSGQRLSGTIIGSLVFYIEGDGLAFRRRNRPSEDPTPIDYFTLQLAAQDPADSVIYLARPCQFLSFEQLRQCEQKYWTSHRYAEEVIAAYDQILDDLQRQTVYQKLILVGYSGGGTIAALLAGRRDDVHSLITLAANLDLQEWTQHHRLSPMEYSLNAADFSQDLTGVAQWHWVGADDEIVPPRVVESYIDNFNGQENIRFQVIPDYNHRCCWLDDWKTLRSQIMVD